MEKVMLGKIEWIRLWRKHVSESSWSCYYSSMNLVREGMLGNMKGNTWASAHFLVPARKLIVLSARAGRLFSEVVGIDFRATKDAAGVTVEGESPSPRNGSRAAFRIVLYELGNLVWSKSETYEKRRRILRHVWKWIKILRVDYMWYVNRSI